MIQLVFAISVIGIVMMYALYQYLERRTQKERPDKLFDTPKTPWKLWVDQQAQKAYVLCLRIPILRRFVILIRTKIELVSTLDEYSLRREIMKIIFTVVSISGAIFIVFSLFKPGIIAMAWVVIGIAFLAGVLIDVFIYRVELRLLQQIKDYCDHLRYYYQQTKMIDEAVYEATQVAGPEMKSQAERMEDILLAEEPYKNLQEYEDVAPSRFLKIIAGLQLLVKDQGDVETEKGSSFLRGLTSVTQELNDEMSYRSDLRYKLRGLTVVAIFPMFFALPLKIWATTYFPSMIAFYDSWLGLFSQVTVYALVLLCFTLIRKMKEVTETKYQATVKRKSWEAFLLRWKLFAKFINGIVPPYYHKTHYKLSMLIKEANAPIKIEWLYVQRVVFTVFTFIFILTASFFFHEREKHQILNSAVPVTLMAGNITEDELKKYEALSKFDREIISNIADMDVINKDSVGTVIAGQMNLKKDDPAVQVATERILNKQAAISNAFVKWWELLVAIALAFMTYNLPVWLLHFQRSMRKKEMENEVNQFYILIGILREFDRISVESILIWMERFSVVFREVIAEGLLEFDSGQEEALQNMREKASFEPFHKILNRLELAVVRISIKESFNDSDVERDYYIARRKEFNERAIQEKSWWGDVLGLTPLYALIILYLITPMLYISIVESGDLLMQIQ